MKKSLKVTMDIEGMPQNIYTQLLGYIACALYKNSELRIVTKDLSKVKGCTISVDGDYIIIKGFKDE